jgi:Tfp pilus assembly PilM family ATPase
MFEKVSKLFFKYFPPPEFLEVPFAGIDINDDGVHCIQYSYGKFGLKVDKYGSRDLPEGVVEAGYIKDEKALTDVIAGLVKQLGIHSVRASLPEEKMYLFKTQVPTSRQNEIYQNVEFKIEENVPLAAADAIFYYDVIPSTGSGHLSVSVSVAPRKVVETYLRVLTDAGVTVLSFEMEARSLAHALIRPNSSHTHLIIHLMKKKASLYVIYQGIVSFTATAVFTSVGEDAVSSVRDEALKIQAYWLEYGEGKKQIDHLIICGEKKMSDAVSSAVVEVLGIKSENANIWSNAFNTDLYQPPISFDESLAYSVAAGLAIK